METTSQQCDHHGIVHEWGFDKDKNWTAIKFICKNCNEIRDERFPVEHRETVLEHQARCDGSCEQCVINRHLAVAISTGDAGRPMAQKKWDAELNAYSAARKQGIQPAGTSLRAVQDAVEKSNKAGKAFDANTGGFKG